MYQDVLGDELGWDIISDAVPARGYSATDLNVIGIDRVVPPVISTLGYDAEHYKPDFVYVDLGRNDLGKDPAVVEPAMVDYLTKLRDSYPRAVITVVLPCPMESNPKVLGTWPVLTPKIRTAAEGIGAQVLDPLTEGWYRTVDLIPMQLEDHVHLNSRGAEFYGKKVAQVLRSRGITDMRPSGS